MPVWAKLLVVLAVAVIVAGWGWLLDLSVSAAHAWLVDRIGHIGMRLLIGAMIFLGVWAVWSEAED